MTKIFLHTLQTILYQNNLSEVLSIHLNSSTQAIILSIHLNSSIQAIVLSIHLNSSIQAIISVFIRLVFSNTMMFTKFTYILNTNNVEIFQHVSYIIVKYFYKLKSVTQFL